jgi:hypothetical protein
VSASNTPPEVSFGFSPSATVRPGERVVVTAYGRDREQPPHLLSYRWTSAELMVSPRANELQFVADAAGTYRIEVAVNDGLVTTTARTTITVLAANTNRPPLPPRVTPISAVLTHATGELVSLGLRAQSEDPDGDALTYLFEGAAGNPAGYEISADGLFTGRDDGTYVIYVTARDTGGLKSGFTAVRLQLMPPLTASAGDTTDADRDGYPSSIDCNDSDPRINPGVREICGDGIDQDCRGGDLSGAACDGDGDRITVEGGDCDDRNPSRFPGAPEVCDGQDNDCDSQVDEGIALQTDVSNCGVCGFVCAVTSRCEAGRCSGGEAPAPGSDPRLDAGTGTPNSGGDAGTGTPTAPDAGTGPIGCEQPRTACADGCFDLRFDPRHCGDCNTSCGAGFGCQDRQCVPPVSAGDDAGMDKPDGGSTGGGGSSDGGAVSCPGGWRTCDNMCVDIWFDRLNCGECGRACGAEQFCGEGVCRDRVEPAGDGGSSGGGGAIDAGTAPSSDGGMQCAPQDSVCEGKCVDIRFDPMNCGECGRACAQDQYCSDRVCQTGGSSGGDAGTPPGADGGGGVSCPPQMSQCGAECVPTQFDPMNCGSCGHQCTGQEFCETGVCKPKQGGALPDAGTGGGTADGGSSGGGGQCTPGDMRSCYTGPAGTQNVGVCSSGDQQCMPNGQWESICHFEEVPMPSDMCGDFQDNDCDGQMEEGCPIAALPHSLEIVQGDSFQVQVIGGTPPYTFSFTDPPKGSVSATGVYTAPLNLVGFEVLKVSDSNGSTNVGITIVAKPTLTVSPAGGVINDPMPRVHVTTAVNALVTVTVDGVPQQVPPVRDNGTVDFNVTLGAEGTHALVFTAKVGNGQETVANVSYVLDMTPPAAPQFTAPSSATLTGPEISIQGTAEAGTTVEITDVDGSLVSSTVATQQGTFATSAPLVIGQHALYARAHDEAGNSSADVKGMRFNLTAGSPGDLVIRYRDGELYGQGGTPPYAWSFATNATGGTLSVDGVYVPGPNPGSDVVKVKDATNAEAQRQLFTESEVAPK